MINVGFELDWWCGIKTSQFESDIPIYMFYNDDKK